MSQPAERMRHDGRYHLDDRGQRYCDIFPEIGTGDINVSVIEPGATALWHLQFKNGLRFVKIMSCGVGRKKIHKFNGIILQNEMLTKAHCLFLQVCGMVATTIPTSKLYSYIISQKNMMVQTKRGLTPT